MEVHYLSTNPHKIEEVQAILGPTGVRVLATREKIEELQTEDINALVRDKVLKAFSRIGRPLFVEHTALHLTGLNSLPGGLTQIFWDKLGPDLFVALVNGLRTRQMTAKTTIGYCDSRGIYYFEGEVVGAVPKVPAGNRDFQWDCVFVPDGSSRTFAELGPEKNEFSMRRKALDKFAAHLLRK